MTSSTPSINAVAEQAALIVEEGMLVGLGTGRTASAFVRALARRVGDGLKISAVTTSIATEELARDLGIPLTTIDNVGHLDLDVDGADEIAPNLDLTKGLGGALLREKLIARSARRMVVIADEAKLVSRLGEQAPIPVEIAPFAWRQTAEALRNLGVVPRLRGEAQPFVTDGGHWILDCQTAPLADPALLAAAIKALTGVVDHGLFLGMAHVTIVGRADGSVRVIERSEGLKV